MLLSRPPAKRWKTYASIPAEGIAPAALDAHLHMIGVVFHGDGNFVAVPANPETPATAVTLPVLEGQFWALTTDKITDATTALPFTVLWGPLR
jgi:hypothetical protein